jgi:hypothetical protein
LVELGASLYTRNLANDRPLDYAARYNKKRTAFYLDSVQVARQLLVLRSAAEVKRNRSSVWRALPLDLSRMLAGFLLTEHGWLLQDGEEEEEEEGEVDE